MNWGIIGAGIGIIAAGTGVYFALRYTLGTTFKSKPAEGVKTVSIDKLQSEVKKLKGPFKISKSEEEGIDLELKWDIVDAKWREILGYGKQSMVYTGRMRFDDANKTLKYQEQIVQKSFTAGPMGIESSSSFQKGSMINSRIKAHKYGIKADGSVGEIYNYDFSPADIKGVLRQITNDNGWTLEVYALKSRIKK